MTSEYLEERYMDQSQKMGSLEFATVKNLMNLEKEIISQIHQSPETTVVRAC
jgi:hypothetical protein